MLVVRWHIARVGRRSRAYRRCAARCRRPTRYLAFAALALWSVSRNVVEVKPVYEAGLADPNQWNRVETISAIIELGKDAEVFRNQVERLLKDDPSAEVRDRAGKLLYAMNLRAR